MVITPDQVSLPLQTAGGEAAATPRYYWRALTYDHYDGAGWTAEGIQENPYNAGAPIVINLPEGKQLIHASVRGVEDLANLLYYTGDLVSADKNYILATRPIFQGSGAPLSLQKYVETDIFGARIQSQTYQFDSLLNYASEKTLRESTANYPDYIATRYLGLPAITPSRLFLLVIGMTDNKPTQYDKALAIQHYLRTIPYSLDVPKPPLDQDVADYFIFDLKKGYCDYYATAMVVMARSIGIPARLVMGYASGTYDPVNKSYVITEADAHSWPELYFPNVGWVEFEPTAALPAIQRPPDLTPEQIQQAQSETRRIRLPNLSWTDWLVRGGLAMLAAYILADFWSAVDFWRLRRLAPAEGVQRIYQRLYRRARSLTGRNRPGETPLEYSATLQNQILALKTQPREEYFFNMVRDRVHFLTSVYIQALFSPHAPGKPEFEKAIQVWKHLRGELVSLRLRGIVRRIYESSKSKLSKSRMDRPQSI